MTNKKMGIVALILAMVLLLIIGGITVLLDPFFLYHAPLEGQTYLLYNERYQNDGITRHFEYNALITGTSMTQNFKVSEFDALFGVKSVKVPFSGASFKEIGDFLTRAISRNPELKTVVRGLDEDYFLADKDYLRYSSYPEYLYDDNPFNDVNYLFNKNIFVDDVAMAIQLIGDDRVSTSFDDYSNWDAAYTFSKESVLSNYYRQTKVENIKPFTETEENIVRGSIEQNVLQVARANPQIDFYLFITPYSIAYWDSLNQKGELQMQIEVQRVAIEMMLPYENIHLFSFCDAFDVICDLNNYKDIAHYSEEINSMILQRMAHGENQLMQDNYEEYLKKIRDFYTNYPYDSLFE